MTVSELEDMVNKENKKEKSVSRLEYDTLDLRTAALEQKVKDLEKIYSQLNDNPLFRNSKPQVWTNKSGTITSSLDNKDGGK